MRLQHLLLWVRCTFAVLSIHATQNDTFGIGDSVFLEARFDGIVIVSGTPLLHLTPAGGTAIATYNSGSGTNTLVFRYLVLEGDSSVDLEYTNALALDLNGGCVLDNALPADLTLPVPPLDSLSANSDVVIDGIRPDCNLDLDGGNFPPVWYVGVPVTVTVTCTENVTGLTLANIQANFTTLGGFQVVSGNIYQFNLTPLLLIPSNTSTRLNMNGVMDVAGNTAVLSPVYFAEVKVSVVWELQPDALNEYTNMLVRLTFSEPVKAFLANQILVPHGVLLGPSVANQSVHNLTFQPFLDVVSQECNTLQLNISTGMFDGILTTHVFDPFAASVASPCFTIDTHRPNGNISLPTYTSTLGKNRNLSVVFQFDEIVTGVTTSAVSFPGGSFSNPVTSDNITWTAQFTTSMGNVSCTSCRISLNMSRVLNNAGNGRDVVILSSFFAVDTQGPSCNVTLSSTNLVFGTPINVTILCDEGVSGVVESALNYSNGVVSAFTSSNNNRTFVASYTPTTNNTAPTNTISLNQSRVQDALGNLGSGFSVSPNFVIDIRRPACVVSHSTIALNCLSTLPFNITWDDVVYNFSLTDIIASFGTVVNLSSLTNVTYSAVFVPTQNVTTSMGFISVNASGVTNGVGSLGVGLYNSSYISIDTQRPTVLFQLDKTAVGRGENIGVTIQFSEPVTGFSLSLLNVSSGNLTTPTSADFTTYLSTFYPYANTSVPLNTIALDLTRVTDAAGNPGLGLGFSDNFVVDTLHLRLSASITLSVRSLKLDSVLRVTITFSEAVANFSGSLLQSPAGTKDAVVTTDGGVTYTTNFYPKNDYTSVSNVFKIDLKKVNVSTGSIGLEVVSSPSFSIDTARPKLSTSSHDAASRMVFFEFTEAVTGVTSILITSRLGSLSGFNSTDGGITWSAKFTPTISGETNFLVNMGGIFDLAGNSGSGFASTPAYDFTVVATSGAGSIGHVVAVVLSLLFQHVQ